MAQNTAWGEYVVSIGMTGTGGAMASALTDLGYIHENTVSLETADGQSLELFGTGHVLVDSAKQEPTLTLKFNIIGNAKAMQFWETETGGTPAVTKVKSLVNNDKWSVRLASKVVGSETLEIPVASIYCKPTIAEDKGWISECEVKMIMGETGALFHFGKVE